MRVLNFFKPDPVPESAPVKAAAAEDALGVDAFASETPAQGPAGAGSAAGGARTPLLWALAVLVLLEAAPAALWVRAQFQGTAAAQPAPPVAPAAIQAAVCEPVVPAPAPEPADVKTAAPATARAAAAMPLAGSIAVDAPVAMRIYDGDRLVGTTEADTVMLGVGSHDLEFVNDDVGFRVRRNVSVQPGRTTTVRLEAPRAAIHINALPWAEVWIDNQRIGETPIGNLQQAIGPHEIVFRHPELGERRTTVIVTLKAPARVSMDLRKK